MTSTETALSRTPTYLGRYELLFPLASGGMAEVYVARLVGDEGFARPVAVKRMLPNLQDGALFEKMFLHEARVASLVRSPNVVPTLELGRADDGSLFLAMELIEGVSIARLLRGMGDRSVPIPEALEILIQAATGLHHAHETCDERGEPLGIVHRDVSPQNILVSERGRCLLTDFGIAKALHAHDLTVSGQVKGKTAYMAPEQLDGELELDRRVDVFALGIVAFELLAGRRLFKRETPAATIRAILEGHVPSLRELRPDVPPELEALVNRALSHFPDDRPQTCLAFAAALEGLPIARSGERSLAHFIEDHAFAELTDLRESLRDALARPVGRRDASGRVAHVLPTVGAEVTVTARPRRSAARSRRRLAVAIAAIAVGLLAGFALWPERDAEPVSSTPVEAAPTPEPMTIEEPAALPGPAETEPTAPPPDVVEEPRPTKRRTTTRARPSAPSEPTPETSPPARTSMAPSVLRPLDEFDRFAH
ncbi:MAG: protein kinase [Sandaracinus sp.]|nr:protein kinase [Sandaracinus sp.]